MNPSVPLDERTADAVLAGRGSNGDAEPLPADLAEVAALAATLRSAATASGRPNAELARVLVEGFPSGDTVVAPVPSPPLRRRRVIEIVLAKLAAGGLAAKAGLAAAAVVGATAGAGAAGMLPDGLQGSLDELRDQDRTEIVVEDRDRSDERGARDEDHDPADVITVGEVPEGIDDHDRQLGRAFGERVAEDASDPDDPGVDGQEIAREASDGRSAEARDHAREASQGRSQTGEEAATRRSAPEDVPAERPSTPAPDTLADRADEAERGETSEQAEQRGSASQDAPADATPDEAAETRGAPDRTPGR